MNPRAVLVITDRFSTSSEEVKPTPSMPKQPQAMGPHDEAGQKKRRHVRQMKPEHLEHAGHQQPDEQSQRRREHLFHAKNLLFRSNKGVS